MTNEPRKDIRDVGPPAEAEGLKPLDPPEPLVVPPEQLRERYEEMVRAFEEDEANRVFHHFAEEIRVKSYGQVFAFMRRHMAAYKQAREMPGFLAGGIKAVWWNKRFYTYMAWDSPGSRERFVSGGAHAALVHFVVSEVGAPGSSFAEWDSGEPPEWKVAEERLDHPQRYYVAPDGMG